MLELHLWIHSPRFDNRTGFNKLTKDRGEHDYKDYADRIAATLDTVGPMLVKEMDNNCAFAKSWSEEIAAPVVTTEVLGPVVAHGPSRPRLGLAARLVRTVHDAGG